MNNHAVFRFSTKGDGPMARTFDASKEGERLMNLIRFVAKQRLNPKNIYLLGLKRYTDMCFIEENTPPGVIRRANALITNVPGMVLSMTFAGHPPVAVIDDKSGATGLVYCGWRSLVVAKIVSSTIEFMSQHFNSDQSNFRLIIGPGLRVCDYELSKKDYRLRIIKQAGYDSKEFLQPQNGSYFLNLPNLIRYQANLQGVERIEDFEVCTACTDIYFPFKGRGTERNVAILSRLA